MADISEVARRAATDPGYAAQLLEGEEYPEVRDAIIADLKEADEVEGFNFETFTLVPGSATNLMQQYVLAGPKPGGVNLGRLAGQNMAW